MLRFQVGLESHVQRAASWAELLNVLGFGLKRVATTESVTVPLAFTAVPRRFRPLNSPVEHVLSEQDLLESEPGHLLLLGDPGAGKTTTTKRLIQDLLTADHIGDDAQPVPLLVVVNEHADRRSLLEILQRELHIDRSVLDSIGSLSTGEPLRRRVPREAELGLLGLEEIDLDHVDSRSAPSLIVPIAHVMDNLNAILFVDGLDEARHADDLVRDLKMLGRQLRRARIIVTCRSAFVEIGIDGYRPVEICPLDTGQISGAIERYLGEEEATQFLAQTNEIVQDLLSKPLYLMQMLIIYDRTGRVPQRPCNICAELVDLCIRDWDRNRHVNRPIRFIKDESHDDSDYSAFGPPEKMRFLAALAFDLLYNQSLQVFSREELEDAYQDVAPSFSLPILQHQQVARELESHTGVIVEAGTGFKFSHLSIQEYLAAEHLSRMTNKVDYAVDMLEEYPNVVGSAVSLVADPSEYLVEIVRRTGPLAPGLVELLFRISLERPAFEDSRSVGRLVVFLVGTAGTMSETTKRRLLSVPSLNRAARNCLRFDYRLVRRAPDSFHYTWTTRHADLVSDIQLDRETAEELFLGADATVTGDMH